MNTFALGTAGTNLQATGRRHRRLLPMVDA